MFPFPALMTKAPGVFGQHLHSWAVLKFFPWVGEGAEEAALDVSAWCRGAVANGGFTAKLQNGIWDTGRVRGFPRLGKESGSNSVHDKTKLP